MFYFKWVFYILILAIVASFLHYTLPQRDIVRVIGTEVVRMDVGSGFFWASKDAGTQEADTRDVRFINAVYDNGNTMEFRNEDTSWSWPFYFKFDSGGLQAEAQLAQSQENQWYAVRHYGWRFNIWSIYPNAISMAPVDGPDVRLIPWFNIIVLTILFLFFWFCMRRIQMFRTRRIDPVLEGIDEAYDDSRGAISRWLGSWRR